ncbi:hypothetical protein KJ782_07130 [Patescibacteria group bacterium]|nr:hypothetical protein [Patescibacteria group bacterium]
MSFKDFVSSRTGRVFFDSFQQLCHDVHRIVDSMSDEAPACRECGKPCSEHYVVLHVYGANYACCNACMDAAPEGKMPSFFARLDAAIDAAEAEAEAEEAEKKEESDG